MVCLLGLLGEYEESLDPEDVVVESPRSSDDVEQEEESPTPALASLGRDGGTAIGGDVGQHESWRSASDSIGTAGRLGCAGFFPLFLWLCSSRALEKRTTIGIESGNLPWDFPNGGEGAVSVSLLLQPVLARPPALVLPM